MRGFLVLILMLVGTLAHAVYNSPTPPPIPADLLFYQSCRSHLINMMIEQTPAASKSNPFPFGEIYGKSGRSCSQSRDEYNRDGWKDKLKMPETSGCVEAILYAYHGKNDTEMGKLTIQWCHGLK